MKFGGLPALNNESFFPPKEDIRWDDINFCNEQLRRRQERGEAYVVYKYYRAHHPDLPVWYENFYFAPMDAEPMVIHKKN